MINNFPKFFICENLEFPNSTFVLHINYPKFMVDLYDEKIIWLEDEENNLNENLILFNFKDLISESIDWAIEETDKLNKQRINDINNIKENYKIELYKKIN